MKRFKALGILENNTGWRMKVERTRHVAHDNQSIQFNIEINLDSKNRSHIYFIIYCTHIYNDHN